MRSSRHDEQDTDQLLHEQKTKAPEAADPAAVTALDETLRDLSALKKSAEDASNRLLLARHTKQEIDFLRAKYPNRLRNVYLQVSDFERTVGDSVKKLLDHIDAIIPKQ